MSSDTFNLLIEQLLHAKADVKTFVLYHGGEPFLNKISSNILILSNLTGLNHSLRLYPMGRCSRSSD